MAKTYRKATEVDIKAGRAKSTNELTLEEATAFYNKLGKETGAKKFRYKGEIYDLSGNKSTLEMIEKPKSETKADKPSSLAPTKSQKPKAKPAAATTVAPVAKGGGGADAGQMPATGGKPRGGRGDGASEVARRSTDAKSKAVREKTEALLEKERKEKAQEAMSDRAKAVAAAGAAIGAAVLGGRAVLKGAPKAPTTTAAATNTASKPVNPEKTGGPRLGQTKTGNTRVGQAQTGGPRVGQSKVAAPTVTRGPGGGVSAPNTKAAPSTPSKATPTVTIPKYNTKPSTPPKKGETKPIAPPKKGGPRVGQSKAAAPTVARGAAGGVRVMPSPVVGMVLGKNRGIKYLVGGNQALLQQLLQPHNFSKGGMVKKDKK